MTRAILKQNSFKFQNNFYVQNKGLAMGAPASSFLSKIDLQFIEPTAIYKVLLQTYILGYFLYVDNMLLVYNDSTTDIDKFLNSFNSLTSTMKFTVEKEVDNTVNILDITMQKRTFLLTCTVNPP